MMLRLRCWLLAIALFMCAVPRLGWAQGATTGSIAGVVKDATGAVLPGVTVEAASPVLIEKMVSTVTDAQGNYKIVNLRPGTYSITFSLTGFTTVKREGIELSVGTTAAVNGELKVGSLQETVTVTGASPVVDVQNVRTENVITQEVLNAVPTSKSFVGMAALTLGATGGGGSTGTSGNRDVGGNNGEGTGALAIHGSRADGSFNLEGMRANSLSINGSFRRFHMNQDAVQETVAETGSQSAEVENGGVSTNLIIREGGNVFHGLGEAEYTGKGLQNNNISQELRDRGLQGDGNKVDYIYAAGGAIGGPIQRDKLWFFSAARQWATKELQSGIFYNAPQYEHTIYFQADPSHQGFTNPYVKDSTSRFTWQASTKNKFSGVLELQKQCSCYTGLSALNPPDRTNNQVIGVSKLAQVNWNNPHTNRLLFEAGFATRLGPVNFEAQPSVSGHDPAASGMNPLNSDLSVSLTTGLSYGPLAATPGLGGPYGFIGLAKQFNTMFAVSYVTGSHAFKFGEQSVNGENSNGGGLLYDDFPYNYTATGGSLPGTLRPTAITSWITPATFKTRVKLQMGAFAQDQWTLHKLTLNVGARMDMLNGYAPASTRPASPFSPAIDFPETDHLPNWKDITPRLGAAYDVFGDGKTAVKAAIGKYVISEATTISSARNAQAALSVSTSRTWNDANGDLIPQCNLTNPAANGECGPFTNAAFGKTVTLSNNYDPNFLTGFGVRPYDWQTNATLQQDLGHGMAVNLAYFRTWFGNISVTQNTSIPTGLTRAVNPSDYTKYCFVTPADARLGAAAGQTLCAYDINFPTFASTSSLTLLDKNVDTSLGATTGRWEHFNGFDVSMRARFGNGGLLNGGVSFGKSQVNNCTITDNPGPGSTSTVILPDNPAYCNVGNRQDQVKFNAAYPLWWGITAAAVYQNLPGTNQTATLTLTSAQLRAAAAASNPNLISTTTGLGRNLSSATGAVSIGIIPTNALREKRAQQLDLRFSKTVRFSGKSLRAGFDIYNATNSNDVLGLNTTYTPSATTPGGTWLTPTNILPGRLYKFNVNYNF